jgi:hypothetical protein
MIGQGEAPSGIALWATRSCKMVTTSANMAMSPAGMPTAKPTMRSVLGPLFAAEVLVVFVVEMDGVAHELWLPSPMETNSSTSKIDGVFVLSQLLTN